MGGTVFSVGLVAAAVPVDGTGDLFFFNTNLPETVSFDTLVEYRARAYPVEDF